MLVTLILNMVHFRNNITFGRMKKEKQLTQHLQVRNVSMDLVYQLRVIAKQEGKNMPQVVSDLLIYAIAHRSQSQIK